jgi:hypothetical protein
MKRFVALASLWLLTIPAGALAAPIPWPASCVRAIIIGQTINGALTTQTCYTFGSLRPPTATDVYAFSGTAGQKISIAMSSTSFDTWLELYDVNDVLAAFLVGDDNGGGGTNSRIPATNGYYTLPKSGAYYIWAGVNPPRPTRTSARTPSR